jgi:1-acyl-sn-glycerol-3-phosphate acyltransferase
MTYFFLKTFVLGPLLRVIFRPWIRGVENIPTSGAAILASNHLSFSDSIFLPLMLRRPVTFLAKSEYFTGKGLKGALTRWFFKSTGQLPIDRSGGKASEASLTTGLGVLAEGNVLGIYPEGTRSPAMIDTEKVQPIGQKMPRIRRVGINIGAPLDFSRFEGMEGDRIVLRAVTDEIMYELQRLSGQVYEDVYATSVKSRMARAAR